MLLMNLSGERKRVNIFYLNFGRKEGKEHSWKEKMGFCYIPCVKYMI